MRGSVETARRILAQGNCSGVDCRDDSCPFYDRKNSGLNTNCVVWLKNNNGIFDRDMDKVRRWLKKQENEKMIDLTKNQIVDPPVKCWVRSNPNNPWCEGELMTIDHRRNSMPFVTRNPYGGTYGYNEYCTLTDPTVPQYRHLNPDELSCMVGTVLATRDRGVHAFVVAFDSVQKKVLIVDKWYDAEWLYDQWLRLDGSPVGVLIK